MIVTHQMTFLRVPSFIALMLGFILPANGMVFWNADNSANQTDPGTGVPWGSVAKVVDSGLTLLSGSAVYLGNGYMLTANHVTMDATFSYVSFDGVTTFQIDSSFNDGVRPAGKQVASNVDMAVFKLTTIPSGPSAVQLLSTPDELIASATQVGWGVGRDPGTSLSSLSVPWGNASTSAHRWGVNEPKAVTNISFGSGSYEALVTIAGASPSPTFSPTGLGDSESAATLYDSGSGLFQVIASQWQLIGLTTGVDVAGTSLFGNDKTVSPHGDGNYFVRISTYESQIVALIPEPTTPAILAFSAALLFFSVRFRREAFRRQPQFALASRDFSAKFPTPCQPLPSSSDLSSTSSASPHSLRPGPRISPR